ncbi:MAG: hypothetical protein ABJE66_32820 [Deltaproteobacteria bacterium]
MRLEFAVVLAGCASTGGTVGTHVSLRDACTGATYWNGRACAPAGDAPKQLEVGAQAIAAQDPDAIKAAVDAAEKAGPLDYKSNVELWEERGIGLAYGDDDQGAKSSFDMMLALDPKHVLSYRLSPKATLVFEEVRKAAAPAPALDVTWTRGQKVGDPVPIDIEVIADPKRFLDRATLFVRSRGEARWHATDLALAKDKTIVLPAITATAPVSLELYLRAYDAHDNEVLTWADPQHPRELALRYEAPTPWYRKWWVWAIGGSAVAVATGITVYEVTLSPPETVGGTATATRYSATGVLVRPRLKGWR